jgi:hypothetical protein
MLICELEVAVDDGEIPRMVQVFSSVGEPCRSKPMVELLPRMHCAKPSRVCGLNSRVANGFFLLRN